MRSKMVLLVVRIYLPHTFSHAINPPSGKVNSFVSASVIDCSTLVVNSDSISGFITLMKDPAYLQFEGRQYICKCFPKSLIGFLGTTIIGVRRPRALGPR